MLTRTASVSKLLAALVFGLAAVASQAVELRGFRGIAWGEGAVKLGEAEVVSQNGDVSCYRRERENLVFGDSDVTGVRYCFHQDRLFLVSVESEHRSEVLAGEFQRTYGRPQHNTAGHMTWAAKPGISVAEVLPVANGQPGSTLVLYSTQFDPSAIKSTVARVAAAPQSSTRVAYLAK